MKTYDYYFLDINGDVQIHGDIVLDSDIPFTQVIRKIEEHTQINIDLYAGIKIIQRK